MDVRPVTGVAVMRLRGELDFRSAVQLHEAVAAVVSHEPPYGLVVVDCAALAFCDSSGISSLVRLHLHVSGTGGRLRLAAVPTSIARAFELTGLDQAITVHASTEEALAAGPGGHDRVGSGAAGDVVRGGRAS